MRATIIAIALLTAFPAAVELEQIDAGDHTRIVVQNESRAWPVVLEHDRTI